MSFTKLPSKKQRVWSYPNLKRLRVSRKPPTRLMTSTPKNFLNISTTTWRSLKTPPTMRKMRILSARNLTIRHWLPRESSPLPLLLPDHQWRKRSWSTKSKTSPNSKASCSLRWPLRRLLPRSNPSRLKQPNTRPQRHVQKKVRCWNVGQLRRRWLRNDICAFNFCAAIRVRID